MAKVVISPNLKEQILIKFKQDSIKVFELIKSLENNPRKGKSLSHVAEYVIKELRYENFRLYFVTDGRILKFGMEDELINLIIKVIRMSDKKNQQKIIDELKDTLKSLGFDKI